MSVVHYKHDMNMTSSPLCGRAPAWAQGTLREHRVTCKTCLKMLAAGKANEVLSR